MKIIVINSSGRKNGNTARLAAVLEEKLTLIAEKKGAELKIRRVELFDVNILPCRGCRACFDRGEEFCPLKDPVLALKDEIAQSDGLVLMSPVYVEDVNGVMKTWIDRMAFLCHRPAFYGRCALVLTTSGGGASSRSLHTMKNALGSWGFHIAAMQNFKMGAKTDAAALKRLSPAVERTASSFVAATAEGRAKKPSFFSLLAFRMQQLYHRRGLAGQKDRDYWESRGWLAPGAHYYLPVNTGLVRLAAAAVLGGLAARFFM